MSASQQSPYLHILTSFFNNTSLVQYLWTWRGKALLSLLWDMSVRRYVLRRRSTENVRSAVVVNDIDRYSFNHQGYLVKHRSHIVSLACDTTLIKENIVIVLFEHSWLTRTTSRNMPIVVREVETCLSQFCVGLSFWQTSVFHLFVYHLLSRAEAARFPSKQLEMMTSWRSVKSPF